MLFSSKSLHMSEYLLYDICTIRCFCSDRDSPTNQIIRRCPDPPWRPGELIAADANSPKFKLTFTASPPHFDMVCVR